MTARKGESLKSFEIGRVSFSQESCVVIAEAGVNHLGDMAKATELVRSAKNAGADIIKFQTYKATKLTTKDAPRFWNWEGEIESDGSQFDSYARLDSFGETDYTKLKEICDDFDIEFMSTPFDLEAVDMLDRLGVNGFKVASCDITNFPLLRRIASKKKPVLLSSGASTLEEIRGALNVLQSFGASSVLIMHCTLTYPTPPADANLSAITNLLEEFPDNLIGYSDHTLGIDVPAGSVLLGASAIEKHFTFDKSLPLSADHWLSADEAELTDLVRAKELYLAARGSGGKRVLESERLARDNARRSLVASHALKKGATIDANNIESKRPGSGIAPSHFEEIIGKRLRVDVSNDHIFSWEDFD